MSIAKSTLKRIVGIIYAFLCLISAGLFVTLIGFCLTMMWATGEGWYWKLPLVFCVPLSHLIVFIFTGKSASPENVIDWCFANELTLEEDVQLK